MKSEIPRPCVLTEDESDEDLAKKQRIKDLSQSTGQNFGSKQKHPDANDADLHYYVNELFLKRLRRDGNHAIG